MKIRRLACLEIGCGERQRTYIYPRIEYVLYVIFDSRIYPVKPRQFVAAAVLDCAIVGSVRSLSCCSSYIWLSRHIPNTHRYVAIYVCIHIYGQYACTVTSKLFGVVRSRFAFNKYVLSLSVFLEHNIYLSAA